jgi:hypothetical protein
VHQPRNLLLRRVTEQSSTADPGSAVYLRRIAGTNGTRNQPGTCEVKARQDFMVIGDTLLGEYLAFISICRGSILGGDPSSLRPLPTSKKSEHSAKPERVWVAPALLFSPHFLLFCPLFPLRPRLGLRWLVQLCRILRVRFFTYSQTSRAPDRLVLRKKFHTGFRGVGVIFAARSLRPARLA